MRTALALLETLRTRGVQVWVSEDNQLRYRAPTGVVTEELRSQLREQKAELLTLLHALEAHSAALAPLAHSPESEHPLTFMQRQLWFVHQLAPQLPLYNIPAALRLHGRLDVAALEASIARILQRHAALRTILVQKEGRLAQRVLPWSARPLRVHDLRHLPAEERDQAARHLLEDAATRPFALDVGPLYRAVLIRRTDDDATLVFTMHHSIADAWSFGLLVAELAQLYENHTGGASRDLPPLRVQYGDFARWQSEAWERGDMAASLAFWETHVRGAPALSTLLPDMPRPPVASYRGATETIHLSPAAARAIAELSHRAATTPFTTLFAAFLVLLYRYSHQSEWVIGMPFANRSHPDVEPLIGFFVNTLPLRFALDANDAFCALLDKVHDTILAAHPHSMVPFDRLLERVAVERNLRHNPLFQIMAVQHNIPTSAVSLPSLTLQPFLLDTHTAKVDLTLLVATVADTLSVTFEYATDLYQADTIRRLLGHLQQIVTHVTADPGVPLGTIPLLEPAERARLLTQWNETSTPYPLEAPLHQHFEAQAARTPGATAVLAPRDDERAAARLLYGELNQRANQVAHYLRRVGVDTDTVVGLCLERGCELMIGLYGIVKAGGAYMPLDPDYPDARLRFMVADAGVRVIVTTSHLRPRLIVPEGVHVLCLDTDADAIARESDQNPVNRSAPESLAYVIYTSGSTGNPKGVMNRHRGICNRLLWMQAHFHLTPSDVILQKTPYSFDVSVWELFWPLMQGATLVMAKPGGHRDSDYLLQLIETHAVTTIHFVPSMLTLFLHSAASGRAPTLRRIICSGESLSFALQQRCAAALPHATLHNLYGPTEAAVDVTYWDCDPRSERPVVPIGYPIANTRIYILDAGLEPVPLGVVGDLYIAGENVARGYLNRPDLTASKFIPDPFAPQPGSRLYATGDQARYLADGSIEFLGRRDFQVKVRGVRIEIGEIESALRRFPLTEDVVVVARPDPAVSDVQQLVAYIVPVAGATVTVDALRSFLAKTLPDAMIPAHFVSLDALPLTTSGKVDRNALPEPDGARPHLQRAFVAPRDPLEKELAAIWQTVLGIEEIGIHDTFFELGGDSIRSIQVVALARERGIPLSVFHLFQTPSIEALARALPPLLAAPDVAPTTPPFSLLTDADRERLQGRTLVDAYPLSMLQLGLVFHSDHSPEYAVYVTSYHLEAPFDESRFQAALRAMTAKHPIMRTAFDLAGFDEPLQLVAAESTPALVVEDWRALSPEAQDAALRAWLLAERKRPFAWDRAPLFRFHVHRRSATSFQFTVSEPCLDGWSVALFSTDLFRCYLALLQDEPVDATPPAAGYHDYVRMERAALADEAQRRFWQERLAQCQKTFLVPPSATVEAAPDRFVRRPVTIPAAVSERVIAFARALNVPLKSVLLAVHLKVISTLSGQRDIVTGFMTNGRPEVRDGQQIVGLFLNTVPLRLALADGSWETLVHQAVAAEGELLPYRRYPLAQIQIEQGGPLFDAVFNYIHFHAYEAFLEHPTLRIRDMAATDQTYFTLTAQFGVEWSTSRLRLVLDFNAGAMSDRQLEAIEAYYARALELLAEQPHRNHHTTSLLPAEEATRLLRVWNQTASPLAAEESFIRLFEAQVGRTPDRIAVRDEDVCLSYADLDDRASRLATLLRDAGVRPDSVVALLTKRDHTLLTAILALFKLGAAYLPIDPLLPPERWRQILDQSRCAVAITDDRFAPDVAVADAAVQRLTMSALLRASAVAPPFRSQTVADPHQLAYVIYTSGSTGVPKGAMVEQQGMLNHLWAKIKTLDLNAGSIVAQTASQSFDISVWQLLAPLVVGGQVRIVDDAYTHDPDALLDLVVRERITILELVPSFMRVLIDSVRRAPRPPVLPALRWLLVTGEAMPPDLGVAWYHDYPQVPLLNAYGPTECSDDVTHYLLPQPFEERHVVPIGTALQNTTLYVLDSHGVPVPTGVSGELYVGGLGVGRGYLYRPAQTAERFLPDPFSANPGARMYRTGDVVRYRDDGNLEFLGRIDHQVKIRGYRIELGEIESMLRQHPLVAEAVVIVASAADNPLLVAFVVPAAGRTPAEAEIASLRDDLKRQLPSYMVPARLIWREALPLNANGKTDRLALAHAIPVSEGAPPALARPASVTPLQHQVYHVWRQILGDRPLGIEDNFFEVGGHSLQAIQLVARLRTEVGYPVTVADLFAHPTIAALADHLAALSVPAVSEPTTRGAAAQATLPGVTLESRSLATLITVGKLPPVAAAAIGYLPSALLARTGYSREEIREEWMQGMPVVRGIYEAPIGRLAHLTIPVFSDELYENPAHVTSAVLDALELAGHLGARVAALTGLLPSATEYGQNVARQLSSRDDLPLVSTGHATTTAAVVFAIEELLAAGRRHLAHERVGVLGLGSIGRAVLRLMLHVLPHPAELLLCDLYHQRAALEQMEAEIRTTYGYQGDIRLVTVDGMRLPARFYEASFIIGATNVPDVLDVEVLRPGTLIVDDSAPHCFSEAALIARIEARRDLLVTEGGILRAPYPIAEVRYTPRRGRAVNPFEHFTVFRHSDHDVMGCLFSALLARAEPDLAPTLGFISPDAARLHYDRLRQLGFGGTALCCREYVLDPDVIASFVERFALSGVMLPVGD